MGKARAAAQISVLSVRSDRRSRPWVNNALKSETESATTPIDTTRTIAETVAFTLAPAKKVRLAINTRIPRTKEASAVALLAILSSHRHNRNTPTSGPADASRCHRVRDFPES